MASITLSEIKTRCRDEADMANSEFITDAELLRYINGSYGEFYEILVSKFEDYNTTSTTFTIASGSSTYTLPSDFFKLRGVDKSINGDYVTLEKFQWNERNRLNEIYRRLSRYQYSEKYRIMGSTLYIKPESSAPGSYQLWYVPQFTQLSSDSDTVTGYNGWEEYIIIDTAIKMLSKEESSTTDLVRRKREILKRIEEMAANRDVDQPERISDVSAIDYDDDYYFW